MKNLYKIVSTLALTFYTFTLFAQVSEPFIPSEDNLLGSFPLQQKALKAGHEKAQERRDVLELTMKYEEENIEEQNGNQ